MTFTVASPCPCVSLGSLLGVVLGLWAISGQFWVWVLLCALLGFHNCRGEILHRCLAENLGRTCRHICFSLQWPSRRPETAASQPQATHRETLALTLLFGIGPSQGRRACQISAQFGFQIVCFDFGVAELSTGFFRSRLVHCQLMSTVGPANSNVAGSTFDFIKFCSQHFDG